MITAWPTAQARRTPRPPARAVPAALTPAILTPAPLTPPALTLAALMLAALTLAACASAPSPGGGAAFGRALQVCPGPVSNAPPMDGGRRVAGYSPVVTVAGATLARAPTAGCVSSGFGPRRGGAGSFHHGLDIFTSGPRPVLAAGDGVVEEVRSLRGYGRTVLIRHNGRVKTRYAHLSAYERGLEPGRRVRGGEPIGRTGASGNATAVHLHYEIIVNGRARDPLTLGR